MRKTLTLLGLLSSLWFNLAAQEIKTHEYFQIETNQTAYAFGDNINVREAPNTTGKVLTQIKAGTTLKIIDVAGDQLALKGIELPWVKVQFLQNGKTQQGFIWAGLLALDRIAKDGYEFLLGLSKIEDQFYHHEVRVIKQGVLLSAKEYKSFATEGYYFGFWINGSCGVSGVKNIIHVRNGFGACGAWSGDSLLFWDEKQIFYIGDDKEVADSGLYYEVIDFIFPTDKGGDSENHYILKKQSRYDGDDLGNGVEKIVTTVWAWDGKQLVHKKG